MKDIPIERTTALNVEALDADLRASLGAFTSGFTAGNGRVVVHLLDTATTHHESLARQIVRDHDPARLTQQQQQEAQRKARLDQARADYGAVELDLTPYDSQGPIIRLLAQKIAWLERESADLRRTI